MTDHELRDCPRCGHCCPQRPWVGLTDEEIQNIGFEAADRESAVIQAEDKLKEKNGG